MDGAFTDSSSPESSGSSKNRKGRAPPVPLNGDPVGSVGIGLPVHGDPRGQRGSSTPKRTHSFSSFSQLSTNSLPDIKELHPAVLSIANHRHHYQSVFEFILDCLVIGSFQKLHLHLGVGRWSEKHLI